MAVDRREFIKSGAAALIAGEALLVTGCSGEKPETPAQAPAAAAPAAKASAFKVEVVISGLCNFVRIPSDGLMVRLIRATGQKPSQHKLHHVPVLGIPKTAMTESKAAVLLGELGTEVPRTPAADHYWFNLDGWVLSLDRAQQSEGSFVLDHGSGGDCASENTSWCIAKVDEFFPNATFDGVPGWNDKGTLAARADLGNGKLEPMAPTYNFNGVWKFVPKGSNITIQEAKPKLGLNDDPTPRRYTDVVKFSSALTGNMLRLTLTSWPDEKAPTKTVKVELPASGDLITLRLMHISKTRNETPPERLDHYSLHYDGMKPDVAEKDRLVPKRYKCTDLEKTAADAAWDTVVAGYPPHLEAFYRTVDSAKAVVVDETTGCPGYSGPPPPGPLAPF